VRISAWQYRESTADDVGNDDITEITFPKSFVCIRALGQYNGRLYFMDDTKFYYNSFSVK